MDKKSSKRDRSRRYATFFKINRILAVVIMSAKEKDHLVVHLTAQRQTVVHCEEHVLAGFLIFLTSLLRK